MAKAKTPGKGGAAKGAARKRSAKAKPAAKPAPTLPDPVVPPVTTPAPDPEAVTPAESATPSETPGTPPADPHTDTEPGVPVVVDPKAAAEQAKARADGAPGLHGEPPVPSTPGEVVTDVPAADPADSPDGAATPGEVAAAEVAAAAIAADDLPAPVVPVEGAPVVGEDTDNGEPDPAPRAAAPRPKIALPDPDTVPEGHKVGVVIVGEHLYFTEPKPEGRPRKRATANKYDVLVLPDDEFERGERKGCLAAPDELDSGEASANPLTLNDEALARWVSDAPVDRVIALATDEASANRLLAAEQAGIPQRDPRLEVLQGVEAVLTRATTPG